MVALLRSPMAVRVLAAACLITTSATARALTQSDGTPIPVIDPAVTVCSDKNVQVCLDGEEGAHTFDAMAAAAITPETYTPACALTFRVLARGAGYRNTFGWYNVVPGAKPPDSDLHSFLECSDDVGTTKSLDIRSSPYYKGGDIGFFMATPEGASGNCPQFDPSGGPVAGTVGHVYYSEREYNPDSSGPNPFIHLITYNSVAYSNSFYFAWEDLLAGGDNDFDDLLTRVSGIQCTGGGEPCGTGFDGRCAFGSMQCRNGVLECVQNEQPVAETCNGIDDDCNGLTDDGNLCTGDEICFRGSCVGPCSNGEFSCPPGLVCDPSADVCVDAACLNEDCGPGQVCVNGQCQTPCDGVTCPYGQVCRGNLCVDPCASLACDTDYVCDRGVCVLKCQCGQCATGNSCDDATGLCVPDGCVGKTCQTGTHCESGVCVSNCQGAVCPAGQTCHQGQCEDTDSDGGATDGSGGSGGGLLQDGGMVQDGGGGSATGGSHHGGSNASGPGSATGDSSGSCACRSGGGSSSEPHVAWLLLFLTGLVGQLRRR